MLDWARHIREYRLLHGLKQSALAERLGVDQATISRWERGLQQPDLAVQRKLRALVGLDSEVPAAVLDRVVRHSINHMVLLNETLHIQAASQRFAEMLDLRLDQIESRHLDEWLAPETRHMLDRAIADGLLEGRMLAAQFPARLVRLGNGDIHANQNVDMGGSTSISGSASAVGNVTVRGAASVGGALLPGSRHINFPQLDLDHYFQVAQANNQVHVGDMQMNGTSHTPPGGVLWVVGDLNTSAHVTFNGLLVVTGDVHQAGHFAHNQVDDLPAIIVRDGNLHLSGQSVIQGLIYVKSGRVDITGGTNLQGAVVAWGDIKTRGNWGLIDFVEQEPEQEGGNAIEVLAWEL